LEASLMHRSASACSPVRRRCPVSLSPLTLLALLASLGAARADDWPQWLGPKRDGVWRETGIVEKFPAGGPKVRWRAPVGAGYSGPAVAGGRVYLTDQVLAPGARLPGNAFGRGAVRGKERVLCLDEATGKVLWKHEHDCTYEISYPAGPRCTPVVAGGKVYTLGAMGDLLCLDADTGKVLWSKNFPRDYGTDVPLWGFAAHPLLDGQRLICLVGGEGSVAVAFDKDTGKELWKALSAWEPGYAPPMIYEVGGKRQLIIWHPEAVNGLDPETGKVHWSHRFGKQRIGGGRSMVKAGLTIPTPRLDGDLLFVTAFYDGPLMLRLHGAGKPTVEWKGEGRGELPNLTTGLHSIMPTPFIKGGHIYGVCSYGELRCLDEKTGKRVWETHRATTGKSVRWGNAFLVEQGDRFILFNERGDLILARLTPKGYEEVSRANILEPTNTMAMPRGRRVIWSHPAFANRSVYARNDRELVCVSLAADGQQ
jgi:outer membrane protein assembly factor BamB